MQTITNKNDMYIYCEMIREAQAEHVLDAGMFIKRIGGISRRILEEILSEEIVIDGIDYLPEYHYPALDNIYNHIFAPAEHERLGKHYDIAFLLRPEEIMTPLEEKQVWRWLKESADYIVTDCGSAQRLQMVQAQGRFEDVKLEDDLYGIVFCR